jgi:hypothetical protein
MKQILSLLAVIVLTACGTTGQVTQAQLSKPMAKNEARIIVERDTSLLYMAAQADVSMNGRKIASLGRGGSIVHDIPKGRNLISVNTPMSFGNFSVSFDAKAGETYAFLVTPRGEAMMISSTLGMMGDAINASVNDNTGYFALTLQERE